MACIYLACGRDGLVKIGRTSDFKRRLTSLRKEFKRFGNEINFAHTFGELTDRVSEVAERKLIDKLSGVFEQYSGREWFIGDARSAFQAAAIASQESFFAKPLPVWPKLTPEEVERRRREAIALRERIAQAKRARMAERKVEVAQRRALRETRRREIALREAVKYGFVQPELSEPKAETGAA